MITDSPRFLETFLNRVSNEEQICRIEAPFMSKGSLYKFADGDKPLGRNATHKPSLTDYDFSAPFMFLDMFYYEYGHGIKFVFLEVLQRDTVDYLYIDTCYLRKIYMGRYIETQILPRVKEGLVKVG